MLELKKFPIPSHALEYHGCATVPALPAAAASAVEPKDGPHISVYGFAAAVEPKLEI